MTTTNEIAEKTAGEHGLSKVQAKAIVEAVIASITGAALAGAETSLLGFGKVRRVGAMLECSLCCWDNWELPMPTDLPWLATAAIGETRQGTIACREKAEAVAAIAI